MDFREQRVHDRVWEGPKKDFMPFSNFPIGLATPAKLRPRTPYSPRILR